MELEDGDHEARLEEDEGSAGEGVGGSAEEARREEGATWEEEARRGEDAARRGEEDRIMKARQLEEARRVKEDRRVEENVFSMMKIVQKCSMKFQSMTC